MFNENGTIGCYSYTGSGMPSKPTTTPTTTTTAASSPGRQISLVVMTSFVTVTAG